MFPAYGAQTVHMPFGDVYTALQTGIVAMAENGINVYQSNKHYEVAPIMSLTEHEANNNVVWVSDKVWNSLNDEQKGWVQAAADEVAQPSRRRRWGSNTTRWRSSRRWGSSSSRMSTKVVLSATRSRYRTSWRHSWAPARSRCWSWSATSNSTGPERRMNRRYSLVLERQRHLKWRCSIRWSKADGAVRGGPRRVCHNRVLRRGDPLDRPPGAVGAGGDDDVFRLRHLYRHRGGDPAQRPPLSVGDHRGDDRRARGSSSRPSTGW